MAYEKGHNNKANWHNLLTKVTHKRGGIIYAALLPASDAARYSCTRA